MTDNPFRTPKPGRRGVNIARAKELVATGLTHRQVGVALAEEEGRVIRYAEGTIARAVRTRKPTP